MAIFIDYLRAEENYNQPLISVRRPYEGIAKSNLESSLYAPKEGAKLNIASKSPLTANGHYCKRLAMYLCLLLKKGYSVNIKNNQALWIISEDNSCDAPNGRREKNVTVITVTG